MSPTWIAFFCGGVLGFVAAIFFLCLCQIATEYRFKRFIKGRNDEN